MSASRILVIKLSALGDFILALGPMEAIRRHHPKAHITLLTTRPFLDIAQRSGYFNNIIIDPRPKFYDLPQWYFLFRHLNGGNFDQVYDLQMNNRTSIYHRLLVKKPAWSGMLAPDPDLKKLHAFKRHQVVLQQAGIEVGLPDVSWMRADISALNIKKPYILLIPGSAPQHPGKRWPATRYAAFGLKMMKEGYGIVVLGTQAEAEVIARVIKACPGAIDLCGRTSLYDIATLARDAAGAVGNDTGPTHLVALSGCPTLALFCTQVSHPHQSAPIGPVVQIIEADELEDVNVADVYQNFKPKAAS